MMTQFRNSLTWRDVVEYGVSAYGFVIAGKGMMSGTDFVNTLKSYYDCNDLRAKTILAAIDRHVVHIQVRPDGQTKYSIN